MTYNLICILLLGDILMHPSRFIKTKGRSKNISKSCLNIYLFIHFSDVVWRNIWALGPASFIFIIYLSFHSFSRFFLCFNLCSEINSDSVVLIYFYYSFSSLLFFTFRYLRVYWPRERNGHCVTPEDTAPLWRWRWLYSYDAVYSTVWK